MEAQAYQSRLGLPFDLSGNCRKSTSKFLIVGGSSGGEVVRFSDLS